MTPGNPVQVNLLGAPSDRDRIFPVLTAGQIARVASHGRRRQTTAGEVLVDFGDHEAPLFVIVAGSVTVVHVLQGVESVIVTYGPGGFTGEINLMSGRPAMTRLKAGQATEVIELPRTELLKLVQTDAELSEI